MTHFVIVYDRAAGVLLMARPYATKSAALMAAFGADMAREPGTDVRISVVPACRAMALRQEHPGMFVTPAERRASWARVAALAG